MASITSLPPKVLEGVFEYLVDGQKEAGNMLPQNMVHVRNYVWVNRMFKEQVAKVLFRTMFVTTQICDREVDYNNAANGVKSNVRCIIRQECKEIPTRMIFEVGHDVATAGTISKLGVLGLFRHTWPSVRTLHISGRSENVRAWASFNYDELVSLDNKLAKAFPNVTRVVHSIHDPSTRKRPFMADFISQRAGQLSELKVMFPFNGSIDMDKVGNALTSLSFLESGLPPSQLVSCFNPTVIASLELRLNSIDALRTLFSGGGGKILELPQLRTLGLYVDSALASQPVPMEQHAASLLFPSLTHLKLLGKGRVMRDCVSLVSLGQIKQLSLGEEVDVSNNDITMFTGLETLRLCLNMTDVLREKVCRKHWIQNLMSSKIYAKRLVIDGEDLNGSKTTELNRVVYTLQRCITARVTTLLMPPIVQLRDLQELDVRAILQSGSLVKLLKRLPSLRRLHLRVYACISSGVLGPEYTHERKAPTYSYINRTVEFVETTFFEGTGEDKEQTYHIAWLIARMPGLKRWWCVPHKRKLTRKVLKDIAAERRFCFDVKHIRPLLKKM